MAFIIAMVIIGLVVTGIFSSVFLFGVLIVAALAGIVLFFGLVFSWPVIIAVFVIWLMVREKPIRNRRMRY